MWEFIIVLFALFSIQMTLLLSYELGKGENNVTGNAKAHIHIFNKDNAHFL